MARRRLHMRTNWTTLRVHNRRGTTTAQRMLHLHSVRHIPLHRLLPVVRLCAYEAVSLIHNWLCMCPTLPSPTARSRLGTRPSCMLSIQRGQGMRILCVCVCEQARARARGMCASACTSERERARARACVRMLEGHAGPVPWTCVVTVRDLVWLPEPQVREHPPQSDQADTAQSIGQTNTLQS